MTKISARIKTFAAFMTALSLSLSSVPAAFGATVSAYAYLYSIDNIKANSAEVNGKAYTVPEGELHSWGVAYTTSSGGSGKTHKPAGSNSDSDDFTVTIDGLRANTTYYAYIFTRYYNNSGDLTYKYSSSKSFKTSKGSSSSSDSAGDCVVNAPIVTRVSSTEAGVESSYISNGNTITHAGFVYSTTNSNPTRDAATDVYDSASGEDGKFSKQLTRLTENATYYVRAYVRTDNTGTDPAYVYSTVSTFTNSSGTEPSVYTDHISGVSDTGADVTIYTSPGYLGIKERGVVYSPTVREPELYSTRCSIEKFSEEKDSKAYGEATIELKNLAPDRTYYVRAYAIDSNDVYYGDILSFVTKNDSGVVTESVSFVSSSSVSVRGVVTDDSNLIERGFVYSDESRTPKIDEDDTVWESSSRAGSFTLDIENLRKASTYYVRAYSVHALREDEVNYGNTLSFSTEGALMQLNIIYLASGSEVGGETISTKVGDILTADDLNVPNGYTLATAGWRHTVEGVEGDSPIEVSVKTGSSSVGVTGGAFMEGSGNFQFSPDRGATRAEIAQVIYNLASDKTITSPMTFPDVPNSLPAKTAIDYVSSQGIMQGYPDGTFGPQRTITRAEMSVVIVNFYKLTGVGDSYAFPDVPSSHWAFPYVSPAKANGIFSGYPDGTFKPNNIITRAETCKIFVDAEKRSKTPLGTARFTDVPTTHWAYDYIMSASTPQP